MFVHLFVYIALSFSGHATTQVAVLQYGKASVLEMSWNTPQEKANLLSVVSNIHQRERGPSRLGM